MLVIITTDTEGRILLYGPFVSVVAAEKYAHFHKIASVSIITKLNDSGDAMDYQG